MRRSMRLATGTALALLLTGAVPTSPVRAADPGLKPGYDWSGPYAGLKVGYGVAESRIYDPNVSVSSGPYGIDGATGGFMSGYNLQWGNVVVGVDSDMSLSDLSGSVTNAVCAGVTAPCRTEIEFFSTTRLRAGYAMDEVLVFATGGIASGLVNATVGAAGGKSKFHYGFAAGGGVEWAMSDGLHARVEYLYADLQKRSHNFSGLASRVSINDLHLVRAGISIKTGWILGAVLGGD